MKSKTYYFEDEVNDDFFASKKDEYQLKDNYKYIHTNIFYKFFRFIAYRLIMTPIAFIHVKIKYHHKIVNKKVLKDYKKQGYFVYANHTLLGGDAFIPSIVNFPKDVYVIVGRANVASSFTRTFVEMNGALPIPSSYKGMKRFNEAIETLIENKKVIQIYPEAHIWPLYTGIRKFPSTSFRYPCLKGTPVFAQTNVFTKRKFSSFPKVTTYIDGPFFPDMKIDLKERQEKLCLDVYSSLKEKSLFSTYAVNNYIKKESSSND